MIGKHSKPLAIVAIAIPLLAGISFASANISTAEEISPEEKGLAIAKQGEDQLSGFTDFTASIQMILRDQQGQESFRNIRVLTKEVDDNGEKSLIILDTPKDLKGTALLTYSHPSSSEDDQWIYLPALKRVKRISSQNRSGSFVGSEFTYEDISSQELDNFTYKWLHDETFEGQDCYVIERHPVNQKVCGFVRQVIWIEKKAYRTLKVEYFDQKSDLLKVLTFKEYRKYKDKFWRPTVMTMMNYQNGKSTDLIWSDYQFEVGLKDTDFNKSRLTMIR